MAQYLEDTTFYLISAIAQTDSLDLKLSAATELILLLRRFASVIPRDWFLPFDILDGVGTELEAVGRNWPSQLLIHCAFEPSSLPFCDREPSMN